MRWKLARSPRWVQALAYGAFFAVAMTIFLGIRNGDWIQDLVVGVIGGAVFGVLMSLTLGRVNGRILGELTELSPAERQAVVRASRRGAVPTDPDQREAARALMQRRRDYLRASRRWGIAIFAVALLQSVYLAVMESWLWLILGALFIGLLVATAIAPSRIDRRLRLFDTSP